MKVVNRRPAKRAIPKVFLMYFMISGLEMLFKKPCQPLRVMINNQLQMGGETDDHGRNVDISPHTTKVVFRSRRSRTIFVSPLLT